MQLKRITICSKDIELITGKSDRYARKIMRAIRQSFGKQRHQLISINDFCVYTGLTQEEVIKHLEKS